MITLHKHQPTQNAHTFPPPPRPLRHTPSTPLSTNTHSPRLPTPYTYHLVPPKIDSKTNVSINSSIIEALAHESTSASTQPFTHYNPYTYRNHSIHYIPLQYCLGSIVSQHEQVHLVKKDRGLVLVSNWYE